MAAAQVSRQVFSHIVAVTTPPERLLTRLALDLNDPDDAATELKSE